MRTISDTGAPEPGVSKAGAAGGRAALLAALAVLPLLAGCTSRQAEEAQAARQILVGMPVQTLLSCAGVPDRREQAGGAEYFTYASVQPGRSSGSSLGVGVGGGGGNVGLGLGLGIPLGGGGGPSGCTATFTVENDRVSRLIYREDSGDAGACYAIVENCLAAAPGR
ncbi:hypothetical protein [Rhodocista pekingensis]|uniref:Lipoprotein n=1 Tax=Rhodocista pekingensis TaxID=201185 RepID=A0ABW2KRN4_9PROT